MQRYKKYYHSQGLFKNFIIFAPLTNTKQYEEKTTYYDGTGLPHCPCCLCAGNRDDEHREHCITGDQRQWNRHVPSAFPTGERCQAVGKFLAGQWRPDAERRQRTMVVYIGEVNAGASHLYVCR